MNPVLYFLLALTVASAATANAGGPVLDSDGDIIFDGSYYVILGAAGGGVNFTLGDRKPCPLNIAQEDSEVDRGIPIRFSNWKSRVGFVPESENLNIEMDTKPPICADSTYWWIVTSDGRKTFVGTGRKPEPGEDSKWSFFQIKKAADSLNGYKIAVCAAITNYCFNVGIYVDDDGVRRLALNSSPFSVRFVKATGTETSSNTMSII